MKCFARLFLLVWTSAVTGSAQQVSAPQPASQNSASIEQGQAANQASSHDRHHRKHSNGKRRHRHSKGSTQH